ncbi:DNA polymerase IV [Methanohalobium sp.]|uniref:DNA polymerase IV n=1 Tax=Methanohalobium sp. TaxID=2837493 RepID=UPI0025DACBCB|nr:DNA polymerase IV [Methanohalobium sp.]
MDDTSNGIKFHIDMDSFYSSVEVRENPELQGFPVIVGSDPKNGTGRGVVSTCSYEARKYGIGSAMPVSKAYRLCPHAVFLPVNMELYKQVSSRVMNIIKKFSDKFEQVSVDEAYLEIGKTVGNYDEASRYAQRIKDEIYNYEKLTCSIGIAPNKTIAKIASDYNKPDGLTAIKPEEVENFLSPLPVSKIPGVGKKTNEALDNLGMKTIRDLKNFDVQVLIGKFGKSGLRIYQLAKGIDNREVEEQTEVKSISKEDTFDEDIADPITAEEIIDILSDEVHNSLVKKKYLFKTVTLKLRLDDFTTCTRSKTFVSYRSEASVIKKESKELMNQFIKNNGSCKFRLLGVEVSKLFKIKDGQTMITDFF